MDLQNGLGGSSIQVALEENRLWDADPFFSHFYRIIVLDATRSLYR